MLKKSHSIFAVNIAVATLIQTEVQTSVRCRHDRSAGAYALLPAEESAVHAVKYNIMGFSIVKCTAPYSEVHTSTAHCRKLISSAMMVESGEMQCYAVRCNVQLSAVQ